VDLTSLAPPTIAYRGLVPLILLCSAALAILMLDAFVPRCRRWLGMATIVVLVLAFAITCRFLGGDIEDPFPGMFAADSFAHFFDLIFYLAALGAVGLSLRWLDDIDRGEYWALLLLATAGMVSLAHAVNVVTLFVGLELLSVVLYAMTGFLHRRPRSAEAALKYFFLGAFASAFLLYGAALLYGATGTFDLTVMGAEITARLETGRDTPLILLIGAGLVLVGLCFKISAVPFHMWTPDVYEGAPTPVAAFMSVGTKAAAFAVLVRTFTTALAPLADDWRPIVAAIAVATMLVGNLVALQQIGLVAWDHGGRAAIAFYMLVYAAMNLGAFGVVAALERRGEGLWLRDLGGLARRRPLAAAAMALFLLSLAGVPPAAGFLGKFYLIMAAVEAGWIKLAVVAVMYSAIGAYYYLRPIVEMYMLPQPEGGQELRRITPGAAVVLVAAAALVLLLGLAPGGVLSLIGHATTSL